MLGDMRLYALDHLVLNVADVARSLDFYTGVLGLPAERVAEWQRGTAPFPSLRIDEGTIIDLVAEPPSGTNLAHFCLVAAGSATEVIDELRTRGVPVDAEPKRRSGARGDGLSVYLSDPDGNQIEIRCYAAG
jgi:catechol 2,3-dioxygenase-like lactoylglutathione lyase family enzyme